MAERKSTGSNTATKQLSEKIDALDDKVSLVVESLVGKVGDEKPGLLERVRKLEQWVETEKKLIFIVVSTIIIDILTRLWTLIVK